MPTPGRDLLWGLFLASSWTWCIGMFLPIVMLREHGWAGFLLFALPNVAGCTLFGWALPPEKGRRLLARGGWLAALFSVVTIAYHLFFAGFVARSMLPPDDRAAPGTALLVTGGLFAVAAALSFLRPSRWPWMGAAAWIVSLLCWIALSASDRRVDASGVLGWSWTGPRPTLELLSLAWPLLFGFLWSPWFDLTFHRARRESGSARPFAIFGAAFAAMLVFTAAYAGEAGNLGAWVIVHMAVQGIFTVATHMRELRDAAGRDTAQGLDVPHVTDISSPLRLAAVAAAWAVAAGVGVAAPSESNYLRFLVFYGLLVPALGMLVVARPRPGLDRARIPLLAILLLGCVLEELAFNHGRAWLAWIPYALLLAWRWTFGLSRRGPA